MPDAPAPALPRREALRRAALLVGGALSAPLVARVLADAPPAWAAAAAEPLDPSQRALVAAVAERIIPATDTPGARDAGVPAFIETMLAEYHTPRERAHVLDGLAALDARARRTCGAPFVRCAAGEQEALLEAVDREAFARPPAPTADEIARAEARRTERGVSGTAADVDTARTRPAEPPLPHFFRTVKELTILGYYTSRAGATRELRYVQVPGRYDPCVPLRTIGRTWAT